MTVNGNVTLTGGGGEIPWSIKGNTIGGNATLTNITRIAERTAELTSQHPSACRPLESSGWRTGAMTSGFREEPGG